MYNVFIVLIVIASILMTLIVLIQESKGGGLASGFSSSNQIMGVRKTTDVVEKSTWGLAIALVVLSVACAYTAPSKSGASSVLTKPNATALPTVPAANQQPASAAPVQNGTAGQGTPAAGQSQAPIGNR